MKVKVTTTIDAELKQLFDTFAIIHKKSYQEVLEQGMRQILIEHKNADIIEKEIQGKRHTALILNQEADNIERFKTELEKLKIEAPVINNNGNDTKEIMEKLRLSWFEKMINDKNRKKTLDLWSGGEALSKWNWDIIINKFGFENKQEAINWINEKIGKPDIRGR